MSIPVDEDGYTMRIRTWYNTVEPVVLQFRAEDGTWINICEPELKPEPATNELGEISP